MRCCVPFCQNTLVKTRSEGTGITFHELPSDVHIRAAWLRALGVQKHHLPDPAVVCSHHLLDNNFYKTTDSARQIHSNAVPSTVQVCMICLDMDRKLFLLSKHKLKEAYEQLTGLSLCDLSNLKQLVCALCAQRLINFSRFRDLSLRAHSLMMHLIEQRESITVQHKELMKHATAHLQWDLTHTTLDSDYCDLYIIHTDEEEQTAAEKYGVGDVTTVVKTEDSMSNDNRMDNIKKESVYDEYDMNINLEATSEDIHRKAAVSSVTVEYVKCESAIFECSFCYQDFVQEDTYNEHMNMHLQNTDSKQGASQVLEPRAADSLVPENKSSSQVNDAPPPHPPDGNAQAHGSNIGGLDNQSSHSTTSNMNKPTLNTQMRTHTGEKPYSCETCNFKCANKNYLVKHIRIHTGEKPYCCEICGCRFSQINHLSSHISTHTGVKPYSCEMCTYKCARKSSLLIHKRTHSTVYTGTKPYSCDLCNYKCAIKSYLLIHKRIHTGEKPYCCQICNYKCAQKTDLIIHKRTHTGKKPYSCEICNYKCAHKSNLTRHRRTHTGEKPYSCGLCNYKCAKKSYLLIHKRTHTGDKPYCCEICGYKFAHKSSFTQHIKTHIGEKLYSCEICNYNTARKSNLLRHIKTHTGRKPITSMKKKNYLQKTIISG